MMEELTLVCPPDFTSEDSGKTALHPGHEERKTIEWDSRIKAKERIHDAQS